MTALKISISVLAIAALLGTSVVAQARHYRYGYRHSYAPHSYGYSGYRSYYGSSGYSGYYSNGGGASRAISRLGYDGRDSNGQSRGGSDAGAFGGGPGN
jgi:hypothetical protein